MPEHYSAESGENVFTPERKIQIAGTIIAELHTMAVKGQGHVDPQRLILDLEKLDALLNMPNSFLENNKDKFPELGK